MLAAAITSMMAAGCGSSDSPPTALAIDNAWARPTPPGATNGVIYLTITPDIDDTLIGASVSQDVAATATLHKATAVGDEHAHHGAEATGDVTSMPATESIELTSGETFEFAPGTNHIMLTDLVDPLTDGRQFTLKLKLASGRSPTIDVTVANNPPGG